MKVNQTKSAVVPSSGRKVLNLEEVLVEVGLEQEDLFGNFIFWVIVLVLILLALIPAIQTIAIFYIEHRRARAKFQKEELNEVSLLMEEEEVEEEIEPEPSQCENVYDIFTSSLVAVFLRVILLLYYPIMVMMFVQFFSWIGSDSIEASYKNVLLTFIAVVLVSVGQSNYQSLHINIFFVVGFNWYWYSPLCHKNCQTSEPL